MKTKYGKNGAVFGFTVAFTLSFFMIVPARGQSDHTTKLIEGAKKEGKLVWYTTMAVDTTQPLLDAFLKEYPFIKTELVRDIGERIMTRVAVEANAGKWSFDVLSESEMDVYAERKFLSPYVSPQSAAYIREFKEPRGYWTASYVNNVVLAYNTNMVSEKEAPRDYRDVLDPKWKGKIMINATSYHWYGALAAAWGKEKAVQYMRQLAGQQPSWRRSYGLIGQLLGAGEASLAWAYNFRIERMKKDGAPVDWVASFDPIVAYLEGIGMSAKPNNPNAAKLFIDFVLSKRAQEIIRDMRRISARSDVKPFAPKMDQSRLKIKVVPKEVYVNFQEYAKEFRQIFGL